MDPRSSRVLHDTDRRVNIESLRGVARLGTVARCPRSTGKSNERTVGCLENEKVGCVNTREVHNGFADVQKGFEFVLQSPERA